MDRVHSEATRDDDGRIAEAAPATSHVVSMVALWDWRRRVAELYARVRASEPRAGWEFWRAARDDLFRNHPQSPLEPSQRAGFPGLSYFDYDASLRVAASLAPVASRDPVRVDLGRDGVIALSAFARTEGLAQKFGRELTLYWIEGYGGGVFLPFKDATCSAQTYGGGRYLLDTIKGADLGCTSDGRAILDFNFAYQPSCSYSEQWVCPLAPADNVLPAAIRGGERLTPSRR
jgi:uncharacterized protein (DUF1684 family)